MASFVLSFFPLDVLDEIWDLIESVSEGFLTYSFSSVKYFIQRKQLCYFQFYLPSQWMSTLEGKKRPRGHKTFLYVQLN